MTLANRGGEGGVTLDRESDVSWVSKVQGFQQMENRGGAFQTNERAKGEIQDFEAETGEY